MPKSIYLLLLIIFVHHLSLTAQSPKVKVSIFDGVIILGYVDQGGFSNFTGPNINYSHHHSKFILSALPSLRYKTDHATPRNAFVTPSLGLGFTYVYKLLAFQIPIYYNSKTATQNGAWQAGIGIGISLKAFNEK